MKIRLISYDKKASSVFNVRVVSAFQVLNINGVF